MNQQHSLELEVLRAIASLQQPSRANLVTVGEIRRRLGLRVEELQQILRSLEVAGIILCTPAVGPIAVVNLVGDSASLTGEAVAS